VGRFHRHADGTVHIHDHDGHTHDHVHRDVADHTGGRAP
jgi:hydrogenase nickel incorporation protein HypB